MNTTAIYFSSFCAKIQTKQFFSGTIQEKLLNLVVKKKLETEIWFKLGALLNEIVRLKIIRCPSNRRFSADNLIWSPRQSDLSAINDTVQRFSTTKLTSISTSGFKTFILQTHFTWFDSITWFVFVLSDMEISPQCISASLKLAKYLQLYLQSLFYRLS